MLFDLFFSSDRLNRILVALQNDLCTVNPAAHENWRLLDDVTPFKEQNQNAKTWWSRYSQLRFSGWEKFKEQCFKQCSFKTILFLFFFTCHWLQWGAEGWKFRRIQRHERLICVADLLQTPLSCGEAHYWPDNTICLELHNDFGCNHITRSGARRPEGCDDLTAADWLEIRSISHCCCPRFQRIAFSWLHDELKKKKRDVLPITPLSPHNEINRAGELLSVSAVSQNLSFWVIEPSRLWHKTFLPTNLPVF